MNIRILAAMTLFCFSLAAGEQQPYRQVQGWEIEHAISLCKDKGGIDVLYVGEYSNMLQCKDSKDIYGMDIRL